MTDIRDLILDYDNEDENTNEKTAEESNFVKLSSADDHVKVAEQLEALSEEDTLIEDLLKTAIFNELAEVIQQTPPKAGDDSVDN